MAKLTALIIPKLGDGNHGDGGGLYVRISGQSRTWSFRYKRGGKQHWVSLGRVADFTLAEARQKARDARRRLFDGVDVAAEAKAARIVPEAGKTFADVTTLYIEAHRAGWKSKVHAAQWQATIDQHAKHLLKLPVDRITTEDVLKVLRPIWTTIPETASRLRGRIEQTLDYATARHWRTGDNPARWRGHIDALLPARGKVAPIVHHAALRWQELPAVMARLAAISGTGARCAAFIALTAVRSAEARNATWAEIDLEEKVWTIPSARMKGGREHRVPLSTGAMAILAEMAPLRARGDLVFPGGKPGRPLSDVAVSKALHSAAGTTGTTVHGLRSTFRMWCGEAVAVPREVAELALAHVNKDRVEAAYMRSDLFDRRRDLMQAWSHHCIPDAK